MLARLGEVVLREAVAQTSVWNHLFGAERRIQMSVNVAERQLVDPSFPDRVGEILSWAGIEPGQLDLEVTEDLFLRRIDDANRVLHRLAEIGCRIVIDDFGSGTAAFAKIRDLDLVRAVKIDRLVIAGLESDNVSRAMVDSAVAMAEAVGVSVIAEGVETQEQRLMVREMGIDLMQGFLFQQPLPASEFERIAASKRISQQR